MSGRDYPSDTVFFERPSGWQEFENRLKQLDANLSLHWRRREIPSEGVFAHWVVRRTPTEARRGYVKGANSLFTLEELRSEPVDVLDWTDDEGRFLPLDNRLVEELVSRDPVRYKNSGSAFHGYFRMCDDARRAEEKREAGELEEFADEAAENVLLAGSVPLCRKPLGHFIGAELANNTP